MSTSRLANLPASPLRMVFLGTPEFAATILSRLAELGDPIVGVFCRPDARSGRGMSLAAPPTKDVANQHGIPVAQPKTWKDPEAIAQLRAWKPDLAVVAAYGRLLPRVALDTPRFGCINIHASLLPRWRGADPISRAILEGDAITGITIMRMVLEMDAGAILHQREIPITGEDTGASLEHKLAELGGTALVEALDLWRDGSLSATEQDPNRVTTAPLVRKADGRIDWTRSASRIERATRALTPWPCATTEHKGGLLKIWRARVEPAPPAPVGTVLSIDAAGPLVSTGDGGLRLLDVQAAGKRRMSAADWARGSRLESGEVLGR